MAAPNPNALFDQFANDIFSSLFSAARGFTRESVRDLHVIDRLIPASTIYFFWDFAFEGNLPGGGKTTLPLIQGEEEVGYFSNPYAAWAPAPWNTSPWSPQQRILNVDQTSNRFNVSVQARISAMRARLWDGLVPMSGARWKEKKLNEHKNWQFAFELFYDIIQTFMWLGDPDIQRGMKDNFNFISKELETLQAAMNTRRAQKGITTMLNLTGLWLEFVYAVFETMVTRTHSWFVERVDDILAEGKAMYEAAADARGAANCYTEAKKYTESWSDLYRLVKMADWMIMMPMDGFNGFRSQFDSKVVGSMFPMPLRRDQYDEMSDAMEWPVAERLLSNIPAIYTNRQDIEAVIKESYDQSATLREQMRGEPKKLGEEHWISIIKSRQTWSLSHGGPQDQTWGFVAYNLTHKSGEEWEAFLSKANDDFGKAGEWVEGFGEVKPTMGLQWIDGKELGMEVNDIEAAKRHFLLFRNTPQCRRRAWKQDFLVIDTECFSSYTTPPPPSTSFQTRPSHGDHAGYVKLIDTTTFDPRYVDPRYVAGTSPGFRQELKVLGSLVFDDLYPLIVGLVLRPKDLWHYAMLHPMQVYVGPCVNSQEKNWEEVWKVRQVALKTFWKWRMEQEGRQS